MMKQLKELYIEKRRQAANNEAKRLTEECRLDCTKRLEAIKEWDGLGYPPLMVPSLYQLSFYSMKLLAMSESAAEEVSSISSDIVMDDLYLALQKEGWKTKEPGVLYLE